MLDIDYEKLMRIEADLKPGFKDYFTSLIPFYTKRIFVKKLRINSKEYPVYINFPENTLKTIYDIDDITIKIKNEYFPMRNFLKADLKETENSYYHENGREIFRTKIYSRYSFKGNRENLKKEILAKLKSNKKLNMKDFIFHETGIEIKRSLKSLLNALSLALLLIILVLVIQFGSFKQTFVIMTAIPLGVIGVFIFTLLFLEHTIS